MEWISVKNRLPEENEHVLVFDKCEEVCRGFWTGNPPDWSHYPLGSCATDACLFDVTHWMPLPKLPEE